MQFTTHLYSLFKNAGTACRVEVATFGVRFVLVSASWSVVAAIVPCSFGERAEIFVEGRVVEGWNGSGIRLRLS